MPYRVSGSTLTAVGRSQLLARWPGTHSRILSGIPRAAQTVLGVYLKRTRASDALGVLNAYALYKYTHSLTNSSIFYTTKGKGSQYSITVRRVPERSVLPRNLQEESN